MARKYGQMIGQSPQVKKLRDQVEKVANEDMNILITGETGVGKELLAKQIHYNSHRSGNAFSVINCPGLTETLLESEFFGHTKGAFTDAKEGKVGKLELADKGTVFIDEVASMPTKMQGTLLRFIQTGEIEKIGHRSALPLTVDARIITASNVDLQYLVEQGTFRSDLYYRLKVVTISIPPLRERIEDIPILFDYFMNRFSPNGSRPKVQPRLLDQLCEYKWPGNIRELENVVENLAMMHKGETLHELPSGLLVLPKKMDTPERRQEDAYLQKIYESMTIGGMNFFDAVYNPFMNRDLNRKEVNWIIMKGVRESKGVYKTMFRMFNVADVEYKRAINFLRKQDLLVDDLMDIRKTAN